MRVGIAADHGGYGLKAPLITKVKLWGFTTYDFGAEIFKDGDDFPDYIIPLCKSIVRKEIDRGIAICGSGVGACIIANKIQGIQAAMVTDIYSSHQGVEDDNMNVICIGARVVGDALAIELVHSFLFSQFSGEERFLRRIAKIRRAEEEQGCKR